MNYANDPATMARVLAALAGPGTASLLPSGYYRAGSPVAGHRIVPQPGTAYTETGLPADLSHPGDYPAEAFCLRCGKPAVRETIGDAWEHR